MRKLTERSEEKTDLDSYRADLSVAIGRPVRADFR